MTDKWPYDVQDLTPEDRERWLESLEGQRWELYLAIEDLKAAVYAELGFMRRLVYAMAKALSWLSNLRRK